MNPAWSVLQPVELLQSSRWRCVWQGCCGGAEKLCQWTERASASHPESQSAAGRHADTYKYTSVCDTLQKWLHITPLFYWQEVHQHLWTITLTEMWMIHWFFQWFSTLVVMLCVTCYIVKWPLRDKHSLWLINIEPRLIIFSFSVLC